MALLDALQRTGSLIQPIKGRGRPRKEGLRELYRGLPARVAREVFVAELAIGGRRGDFMRAVREVAHRWALPADTVKRHAHRYRDAREYIAINVAVDEHIQELTRRMSGIPDDVRVILMAAPIGGQLLQVLRDNDIDGTCPQWLIDAVRRC